MKSKDFKELSNSLGDDISNYKNLDLGDENNLKKFQVISKKAELIRTEEKHRAEIKKMNNQIELENKKFELEKSKSEREFELKKQETEIEFELKKQETSNQSRKLEIEYRRDRKARVLSYVSLGVTSLVTIGSKVVYYFLTKRAQDFDYNEFKIESSSSKEQRNNLIKD